MNGKSLCWAPNKIRDGCSANAVELIESTISSGKCPILQHSHVRTEPGA